MIITTTAETETKQKEREREDREDQEQNQILLLPTAEIKEKEEYRSLLFPLADREYEELKADIMRRGIQIPLIINAKKELLDGYHRFRIARELQIKEVPCIVRDFIDPLEEKEYIYTINACRRHLSTAQLGEIILRLEEIEAEKGRRRRLLNLRQFSEEDGEEKEEGKSKSKRKEEKEEGGEGGKSEGEHRCVSMIHIGDRSEMTCIGQNRRIKTRDILIRRYRISPNILTKIKKIKEIAREDKEIMEQWKEALQDKRSIQSVYDKVKEKEARKNIQPIVQEAKRRLENVIVISGTATNTTATGHEGKIRVRILHGDFREVLKDIPDNSIDLIFTDPPYSREYLPLLGDIILLATRVLKPSGFLALMYGQDHIDEFFEHVKANGEPNSRLKYYWTIALHMPESSELLATKNVEICWKPIFIFQKEPMLRVERRFKDFISEPKPDKSLHEWRQDLGSAMHVIRSFSSENDIVLDPLAGTGTTVEACFILNRRCIAVEKDNSVYEILLRRFEHINYNMWK